MNDKEFMDACKKHVDGFVDTVLKYMSKDFNDYMVDDMVLADMSVCIMGKSPSDRTLRRFLIRVGVSSSEGKHHIIEGFNNEGSGNIGTESSSVTFDSDFVNCKMLKSVILPNCLETLGNYTFYGCKSLVSVTLPSSLTTIGNSVFVECKNLKAIKIPTSVTEIGSAAFKYCESIESVILPNGLTTIENAVFVGCENLRSITIPNSVTSIGYMAFYRCKWLTSITIPASVEKIGTMSFQYCKYLQSITFEDTTTWYYGDVSYKNGTQISVDSPTRNARYFTSTYVDKYWYKE